MNGPTVLLLILLIAALGTFALLQIGADLDARRDDREMRRAIEAERRKAAALRNPRCLP